MLSLRSRLPPRLPLVVRSAFVVSVARRSDHPNNASLRFRGVVIARGRGCNNVVSPVGPNCDDVEDSGGLWKNVDERIAAGNIDGCTPMYGEENRVPRDLNRSTLSVDVN